MLGPHSIAKTNIQPIDSAEGRRYEVTYVPVETGIYNTYVMWNGRDIEGIVSTVATVGLEGVA